MVRSCVALSVLVLAAAPRSAAADARTEAVVLFDQAQKDMKAGDYAKACKLLQQSNEKWPDSGTKGSLAICYEKSGKVASAWLMWRQLADTGPTKELRADATKRVEKLAGRVPHVQFKVTAATAGLAVTINGDKLDPNVGVALPIDPGKLAVEATAPGREPWTAELTATEGQTTTIEIPALGKVQGGAGKAPAGGGTAGVSFVGPLALSAPSDGNFTRDGQSDGYTLDVKAGMTVRIEVTHAGSKNGLDTLVYVYGPAHKGAYPAESLFSDDDGGWGKLSRITSAKLDAGTYAIVVTTKANDRGKYRIEATCSAGCPPGVQVVPDGKGKTGKGKSKKTKRASAGGVRYETEAQRARSRRHKLGLALGAAGVAGIGAGAYFGLAARSRFDEAKDVCGGAIDACPKAVLPIAQARVDDARGQANLSTVLFGAGIAAVAAGTIVYVTAPKARERRTALAPIVGPDGVGVVVGGRF
ncbi:MAG: PPC domain-containing protein [Deltaproteobacteria bacterium]|nr:PPC domain-containing protein [Deltaproteobacteria bacterium]MCW5803711.1 PPC domain-containing protein [Deltaproteobacteria bacterium]